MRIEIDKQILKSRKFIISVLSILIIVAGIISITAYHHTQVVKHEKAVALAKKKAAEKAKEKKEARLKQYVKDIKKARLLILNEGALAESMANDYLTVWHDAIFYDGSIVINGEEMFVMDFEEAIQKQHDFFRENGDLGDLENGKDAIDHLMKKLKNPPKKYKDEYKILVNMYSDCNQYVSLIESPEGSYNSFGDKAAGLSSSISDAFNKLKIMLPVSKENGSQDGGKKI